MGEWFVLKIVIFKCKILDFYFLLLPVLLGKYHQPFRNSQKNDIQKTPKPGVRSFSSNRNSS